MFNQWNPWFGGPVPPQPGFGFTPNPFNGHPAGAYFDHQTADTSTAKTAAAQSAEPQNGSTSRGRNRSNGGNPSSGSATQPAPTGYANGAHFPTAGYGFPQCGFAPVDPRVVLDEILKCGRGLQMMAEELENKDTDRQQKALVAATRYFFYLLGLLHSIGIILPSGFELTETNATATTRSGACRAAGIATDRFVREPFNGRGFGNLVDLVERLKECYNQLSAGTLL